MEGERLPVGGCRWSPRPREGSGSHATGPGPRCVLSWALHPGKFTWRQMQNIRFFSGTNIGRLSTDGLGWIGVSLPSL